MAKVALAVTATFLVAIRVIIFGSVKALDHGKIQDLPLVPIRSIRINAKEWLSDLES
jgi:hypothetical protein